MLQLWFIANTILWTFGIAIGLSALTLSQVSLVLAGSVWLVMNRRISASSIKVTLLFLAYFAFSFTAAFAGPCTDEFSKSVATAIMLAFLILLGWEIGCKATLSDWANLQKSAVSVLIVAFAEFFVEFLEPAWFPTHSGAQFGGRVSGFYDEPSHVAFALFPCVVILLTAVSRKMRWAGIVALLGLLLFSRSSTLIILLVCWALYRLIVHRKLPQAALLFLVIGTFVAVGSVINYDKLVAPTLDRINGVSGTNSLEAADASSLVYLQGWEDAWANLLRTRGLGLGFNMMGCNPLPEVPARALLVIETGHADLNAEDGSVLFVKIVSEAGVFGIAFYISLIWWWFQLERKLHLHNDDAGYLAATAQAALIFCFVTSSFIRSSGYFTGTFLLLVVAVSGASTWQQNLPKSPQDHAAPEQA